MHTISFSAFRASLDQVLDRVNEDHTPVMITRQNGKPAVLLSLDEFSSYEETAYLLGSANNAQRLALAIEALEGDQGIRRYNKG
ncbi:type II toxin-antitoxin system Phd/YefM family antitoxin [Saccharospirillum salsuginis]|uniref:Antitoxin n=1 Tax=Saccharospirillum salsuginis TaxID=418750 RepID=A0A918K198_9GAMM|nr:type II toxin-antitoxin system prevent-host-death family antitoxin [Saccharospirillum salsuginis]GGX41873.1 antitoxin [Saccharospirillum salsuginis]